MAIMAEYQQRTAPTALTSLEDGFEVIKEIGDGSFGSVALARVRGAGATVARRGTMVSQLSAPDGVVLKCLRLP